MHNPYSGVGQVAMGGRYIHRPVVDELVRLALAAPRPANVQIVGGHRVGKTTIADAVAERCMSSGLMVIDMVSGHYPTFEALLERLAAILCKKLLIEPSGPDLGDVFRAVGRVTGDLEQPVLIVIDEFDSVADKTCEIAHFQILRTLITSGYSRVGLFTVTRRTVHAIETRSSSGSTLDGAMAIRRVVGSFTAAEAAEMIARYDFDARIAEEAQDHSGAHPYLLELLLFELVEATRADPASAFDRASAAVAPKYRAYWDRSLRILEDDSPGSVDRLVQISSGVSFDSDSAEIEFLRDMSLIARDGEGYAPAANALRAHLKSLWRTDAFTGTWLGLERTVRSHLRRQLGMSLRRAVDEGRVDLRSAKLDELERWMRRDRQRYGTTSDEFDYLTTRELLDMVADVSPGLIDSIGEGAWKKGLAVLIPARNFAMHGRQLSDEQCREALTFCRVLTDAVGEA